jgi:ABC-type sugar transport system permease subunit
MREILISEFPANIGVFNSWLKNAGLGFLAHDWLSTDVLLKFKFLGINITLTHALITVALVHCWKGFGWAFVIFLAGLQTIPEQLYEAARIDGASSWQSFFKITLPLLMSVMALIFILTILGTMQAFAMILALTRGSGGLTEVPTMRIYNHVKTSQVGLACAEGVILGIILIVVSRIINTVYKKIRQRWGVLPN